MLLVGSTDPGGFHALLPAGTPSPLADALVQQQSQQLTADVQLATLQPLFDTAEGLETPIQLIYLLALLGFLAAGAYLVVRQVLIRRELDEAAKSLGERIRTGEATCEVSIKPVFLLPCPGLRQHVCAAQLPHCSKATWRF
jgi:hypothetical protein